MLVLITRPSDDARPLAAAIEARGMESLVAPMLEIAPLPDVAVDLTGVQALAFTSANGVRALAAIEPRRDLPVFAVGDATATAARQAGYTDVRSADGDVNDLARLIAGALQPDKGAVFHPAASDVAGDLKGALDAAGFDFRRAVVYHAEAATALPQEVAAALREGRIVAVVFYSPRSAATFVRLAEAAELSAACGACEAVCLSEAVAEVAGKLPWRALRVAERPNQDALLACLDAIKYKAAEADEIARNGDSDMTQSAQDDSRKDGETEAPALRIIAAFGGIRPMAAKLGVAVSTIQGWKERAAIPAARHAAILEAAGRDGIELDEEVLKQSAAPPAEDVQAEPVSVSPFSQGAEPAESTEAEAGDGAAVEAPGEPATAMAEEAAASPADRRLDWAGGFLLGALVFVVGAGVAVLTRDLWSDAGVRGADPALVDALERRVASLESEAPPVDRQSFERLRSQLGDLESQLADVFAGGVIAEDPAVQAALESQAAEIRGLEDRLAALAGDVAAMGEDSAALAERLGAEITALRDSVERLSETSAALQVGLVGDAARVLALLQLREALRGSGPYVSELKALQNLAAADPELAPLIAPLAAHAGTGLPTLADLQSAFPAVAAAVVAAERGEQGEGWFAGVLRRLSGTVTIRRVGMVEGNSPDAVVARAEVKLAAGDLAGALAELDGLEGAPAAAAASWRAQASARLAATQALSALAEGVTGRLEPAGG